MANKTKHAFGARENIETAKQAGTIDAYDVLHLDNGEFGWIDKDGNTVIHAEKTQTAHTLNGTTFGALESGDTIPAGMTLDEIIAMVTQKAIPATYTRPTVSLANNGGQAAGDVEAGTSITPKLKATFTQNDAGALSNIKINEFSNAGAKKVSEGTTSPLTYAGEAFVIGDETIRYYAYVEYGDAPVKKDNLGNDSMDNWFAGTEPNTGMKSNEYAITGKRNLFYGTGVGAVPTVKSAFVRGLGNTKLAPAANTSFTINVDVGQQYIAFAYPADLRDVNNVTYVEANDSGMASSFTKSTIDVADARGFNNGLKSYKVYTYAMDVPAAAAMTFTVVI